jgi:glycerophosphoryl diester phosphodiesterase
VLIYAHRGSSGVAPENTLKAFAQALADGAQGIELDVHATADGMPVVIHDRGVGRTTNGSGNVDELTLAELQTFDAGDGERVPTFAQVLDLVAGRVKLDVEIKQAGIEQSVLDVLARYPNADWAISSFDWSILTAIRALAPDAELWPIAIAASDAAFAAARDLGATAISLSDKALSAEVAKRFWDADLDIVVWTVNRVADARQAQLLGASGLCTDVPATILRGLAAEAQP